MIKIILKLILNNISVTCADTLTTKYWPSLYGFPYNKLFFNYNCNI